MGDHVIEKEAEQNGAELSSREKTQLEAGKIIAKYEKILKQGSPVLMSRDEANTVAEFFANSAEGFGDFAGYSSDFSKANVPGFVEAEKLSNAFILFRSSKSYYDSLSSASYTDPQTGRKIIRPREEILREKVFDPFYRRGLELASNSTLLSREERQQALEDSVRMNEIVMEQTLSQPSQSEKEELIRLLGDEKTRDAIRVNKLQQSTIAKTLFLGQLANLHISQKSGLSTEYEGSMAELFAHGGRTEFMLPRADENTAKAMKDDLFHVTFNYGGQKTDAGSAVKSRIAASHSMDAKRNAEGPASYKESGSIAFSNNYGMNPAIGGLGKHFGNKVILGDGKNGHMFIQMKTSTKEKGGYLMVGFEGEESLAIGRTGHWHSPKPTSANYSCFMAGKGGAGASKNGRIADLSQMDPALLNELLEGFSKSYQKLQESEPDKLARVNAMLSGKKMNAVQLSEMVDLMDIKPALPGNKTFTEVVTRMREKSEELFNAANKSADDALGKKEKKLGMIKNGPSVFSDEAMKKIPYEPEQNAQTMLNSLSKAKKSWYDMTDESPEMQRIKISLERLADAYTKKNMNLGNAKQLYSDVLMYSQQYIDAPGKNTANKRMKSVIEVRNFAKAELEIIDRKRAAEKTKLGDGLKTQIENKNPQNKLPIFR